MRNSSLTSPRMRSFVRAGVVTIARTIKGPSRPPSRQRNQGEQSASLKLNHSVGGQRNSSRSLPFSVSERETVSFNKCKSPHLALENRYFERKVVRRMTSADWVAERVGFEPTVEFPQH